LFLGAISEQGTMTDDEVAQLILEWAVAKGGFFTDEELDSLMAVLEEHFDSRETATLRKQGESWD
jgi:hypothetical protein